MLTYNGLTPSADTQIIHGYRLNQYQLGNGYQDVSPDGVNGDPWSGQLMWDNLNAAQWTLLQAWIALNPPWVGWAGDGVALPTSRNFHIMKDGIQLTYAAGGVVAVQINVEEFP